MKDWTYGCEHEWADWPLETKLPTGYGRDLKDITIVNSNGIANDPSGKLYRYGGEINTPPSKTPEGQVFCLQELKFLLPMAKVNYRSNLHVHIRVPGLNEDLDALKQVQKYIHENLRQALTLVEPIPKPKMVKLGIDPVYEGAMRRWRRRKVSHQTLLTPKRLERQLAARTVGDFFRLEVPASKDDKPLWHFSPRLSVSLRQMLDTDTVEFRHFPGTLGSGELRTAVEWCQEFMQAALRGTSIDRVMGNFHHDDFPKFPEYVHWMEDRYRATVHDGSLTKAQIANNIERIEDGLFDEESPCHLPR